MPDKYITITFQSAWGENGSDGYEKVMGYSDIYGNNDPFDYSGLKKLSEKTIRKLYSKGMNVDNSELKKGFTSVDKAILFLEDQGVEASSSNFQSGVWYTAADEEIDFKTGAHTTYSYHLKGFTFEEEKEIFDFITNKRSKVLEGTTSVDAGIYQKPLFGKAVRRKFSASEKRYLERIPNGLLGEEITNVGAVSSPDKMSYNELGRLFRSAPERYQVTTFDSPESKAYLTILKQGDGVYSDATGSEYFSREGLLRAFSKPGYKLKLIKGKSTLPRRMISSGIDENRGRRVVHNEILRYAENSSRSKWKIGDFAIYTPDNYLDIFDAKVIKGFAIKPGTKVKITNIAFDPLSKFTWIADMEGNEQSVYKSALKKIR